MKVRNEKEEGITLIALVITIIVLLILAGVSLRLVTGNEGILKKAENVKQKSDEAQTLENATLDEYGRTIKKYMNDGSYDNFENWTSSAGLETNANSVTELTNEELTKLMSNKESVDYMINSTNKLMPEIMKSEEAIREIGKNPYVASQVIKNEIWFNNLQNSEYANAFDENAIKVPILTNDTSNGIVTVSSLYSSAYQPYYAFTGGQPNTNSGANIWCPTGSGNGSWIAYEFNIESNISLYKLTFNTYAEINTPSRWFFPKKYVLQCKMNDGDDNDPSNWTDCSPTFEISDVTKEGKLVTNFSEANIWHTVTNYFKSDVGGKKFRLYIYESSGIYLNINQLQMYGQPI